MSEQFVTVRNPLLMADFPDPCVINVDGTYYMTSTSMHFMPGIPIMRSLDLAHWEIISYVYDTFLDNDAHNLKNNQNIYGNGSWATSLRYNKGWFYVCFNSNDARSVFIYRTRDIENGPWEKSVFPGWHHDPSLLFDDDGRTYIVYGCGTIYIKELESDAMAIKQEGTEQILLQTPKVPALNCEGSHFHKINGVYYLMMIQWPLTGKNRRIQWCYRCDTLLGDYTGRVVFDDNMDYGNSGVAQGGLFEASDGKWFAMLFQDRGAVGRIPILLPVKWEDGWPILGKDGKAPVAFTLPYAESELRPFVQSDEFDCKENKLSTVWQWNHNPDSEGWSLLERPGWMRLTNTQLSPCFERARNMLTQRTIGSICAFWTKLDTSGMTDGDYAGLAALQFVFGFVGVEASQEGKKLVCIVGEGENETLLESRPLESDVVYLRVQFNFSESRDTGEFAYSLDGKNWHELGEKLHLSFRLAHFTGYHAALFNYATKQTGGYADFDYLRVYYS